MKILVIHDRDGHITGTVVALDESMEVNCRDGEHVHVVEHASADLDAVRRHAYDLHSNWKIDLKGEPRLIKRAISSS